MEVGGKQVLLVNLDGELAAVSAECTHAGGPLEEGFLENGEIECPWHFGRFDLKTGGVTAAPPILPLPRYKVWIRGDEVLVDVGETVS